MVSCSVATEVDTQSLLTALCPFPLPEDYYLCFDLNPDVQNIFVIALHSFNSLSWKYFLSDRWVFILNLCLDFKRDIRENHLNLI